MTFAKFMLQLMPELTAFARELFQRHRGDVPAARRDIADRRAAIARDRAEADEEIAKLKQERGR